MEAEPAAPARLRPDQPANILVVEDESVNRLTAGRLLEHLGYRPTCAESGPEALELLEKQRFDAVLMDVQMPGMDGLEATQRFRASQGWASPPTIPVVAFTAHSLAGDKERLLRAGMDAYLPKPIEKDQLAALLHRLLNTPA